jgi:light-regulated signal transduction histidine kinase (bacteriophytochrome)
MKFLIKENNKIIAKNINQIDCCLIDIQYNITEKFYCNVCSKKSRRGAVKEGLIEIIFISYDNIDSTKLWRKQVKFLFDFVPVFQGFKNELEAEFIASTDRLTHNLKKYNAHCVQASENILDPYSNSSGTKAQIDTIKNNLVQNVTKSSISLLKIIKNNKLIQAELSVYDRLYKNNNGKLEKLNHSIHRLIKATISAFWDSFLENSIEIKINNCYDEVFVDYETITVALVHIIENCTKYICPHSILKIDFNDLEKNRLKIIFSMLSVKILEEEKEEIFKEGISGENSCKYELKGNGVGLFLVKKFIELNDGQIILRINTNVSKNMSYNGIEYEENHFEIILPKIMN